MGVAFANEELLMKTSVYQNRYPTSLRADLHQLRTLMYQEPILINFAVIVLSQTVCGMSESHPREFVPHVFSSVSYISALLGSIGISGAPLLAGISSALNGELNFNETVIESLS